MVVSLLAGPMLKAYDDGAADMRKAAIKELLVRWEQARAANEQVRADAIMDCALILSFHQVPPPKERQP